jgi:hypothetical protein
LPCACQSAVAFIWGSTYRPVVGSLRVGEVGVVASGGSRYLKSKVVSWNVRQSLWIVFDSLHMACARVIADVVGERQVVVVTEDHGGVFDGVSWTGGCSDMKVVS